LSTCERQELVGAGAHTLDILNKNWFKHYILIFIASLIVSNIFTGLLSKFLIFVSWNVLWIFF
jgi:hypothetical protein